MTLPELLIVMSVIGVIATVITMAITVSYRTLPSSNGRLNVARAEQNIALYMPADLSSATAASSDPADSPCGAASCPGVGPLSGSSALMVEYPDNGDTITVSYVYQPVAGSEPERYQLARVKCVNGAGCSSVVVLRELEGPPHASFVPGVTPVPASIIDVTVPLLPGAGEDTSTNYDSSSTANRIVVSVNGGGTSDGAGGGLNRISITAGGTQLGTVAPATVTGPSFLQARSQCGGPITLIVDESGSINASELANVKSAVNTFIDELAGTPTQVQVVRFSDYATVLDHENSGAWNRYYDMTDDSAVTNLKSEISTLTAGGSTNWEDALFRTFYAADATPLNQDGDPDTKTPELVVFFTDGVPTIDRSPNVRFENAFGTHHQGAIPTDPAVVGAPWPSPSANGLDYSQVSWNRADYIADKFRDVSRIIGVGVGTDLNLTSHVYEDPGYGARHWRWNGSYYEQVTQRKWSNGYWYNAASYTTSFPRVANSKVLGHLVAGGAPHQASDTWIESTLVGGEWTNTDTAELFLSPNWADFPSALKTIAVGECGGTLTLQTELNGAPAPANVTYETGGKIVSTSLASRAAAFDIDTGGNPSIDTDVRVQGLEAAGYTADSWTCRLRGLPLDASRWSLTGAAPADGITVEVGANEAVSCKLKVTSP